MPLAAVHKNLFVIAARTAAKRGAFFDAETRYRQAIAHCQKHTGKESAACGLLLIELSYFYEDQNRQIDADRCWKEVRKILVSHYRARKGAV